MIPGGTSTGSKRPELLFGTADGVPGRLVRSKGCRGWDDAGREYIDFIMALGAVSLGYGHPAVTEAAAQAVRDGVVGSLAPALEVEVAERLAGRLPGVEAVRFLKTGAEAVAAAVRIARVETGRERIITVGYQGWLDGLTGGAGVPTAVAALRTEVPFNDVDALTAAFDGSPVAALVMEPVVDGPPTPAWVDASRSLAERAGAVVVLDEIKTGIRMGPDGARGRYGLPGDLVVLGKALGNGFPIAAVCGPEALMDAATRTWISSTLATETVSLAAARAVLDTCEREPVTQHLAMEGGRWYMGLEAIAQAAPHLVEGVRGVPEFSYLAFADPAAGQRVARRCAELGLLFKWNAYNFVSVAHTEEVVRESLECVRTVVEEAAWGG